MHKRQRFFRSTLAKFCKSKQCIIFNVDYRSGFKKSKFDIPLINYSPFKSSNFSYHKFGRAIPKCEAIEKRSILLSQYLKNLHLDLPSKIIMHFGGTFIFFVDCRYHCFFLDLSAVWINWLDMKTQISEQKQNKNHCFNYSLQIRGLPKLHYSTDVENIIGAPKMQNNFWCTIKLIICDSNIEFFYFCSPNKSCHSKLV